MARTPAKSSLSTAHSSSNSAQKPPRRRGTPQKSALEISLLAAHPPNLRHQQQQQREKTPPPNGVDGFMFTSPVRSSKKAAAAAVLVDKSNAGPVARRLFAADLQQQKRAPLSPSKNKDNTRSAKSSSMSTSSSSHSGNQRSSVVAGESTNAAAAPVDSMLFSPYPCAPKHKYFTRSQVVQSEHSTRIVHDDKMDEDIVVDKFHTVIREDNAVGHRDIHIHREHSETLDAHAVIHDEVTITTKFTPDYCTDIDISDLETEEAFDSFLLIHKLNRMTPLDFAGQTVDRFPKKALPPKADSDKRLTLVLDLDETLVHCSTDASKIDNPDLDFNVTFQNRIFNVFVSKRPRVMEFLDAVSKHFEVVIFTASQQIYADKLLDLLDPERNYTRYRLFRDSCVPVDGTFVKDLRVLGRDLSKVIIVDNAVEAFTYQIDNGVPIKSWFSDHDDQELVKVFNFLIALNPNEDVRDAMRKKFQLSERIMSANNWYLQNNA